MIKIRKTEYANTKEQSKCSISEGFGDWFFNKYKDVVVKTNGYKKKWLLGEQDRFGFKMPEFGVELRMTGEHYDNMTNGFSKNGKGLSSWY